jgi:hypothetical protein
VIDRLVKFLVLASMAFAVLAVLLAGLLEREE